MPCPLWYVSPAPALDFSNAWSSASPVDGIVTCVMGLHNMHMHVKRPVRKVDVVLGDSQLSATACQAGNLATVQHGSAAVCGK